MLRLALVLAALLPSVALAGSHAGALKLSGQAGYAYSSSELTAEGSSEKLELTSQRGRLDGYYLFHANVGAGAWLELEGTKQKLLDEELGEKTILVGPALLLELPVSEQLALFAEGAYLFGKTVFTADGEDQSVDSHGFGVAGGVAWFPVHAVSLDLGLRYTSMKVDVSGVTTTTATVGFQAGFSVYFGGGSSDGWGSESREGGKRMPSTGAGNPSPW